MWVSFRGRRCSVTGVSGLAPLWPVSLASASGHARPRIFTQASGAAGDSLVRFRGRTGACSAPPGFGAPRPVRARVCVNAGPCFPPGSPLTLQGPLAPLGLALSPPARVLSSCLAIPLGSQQEDRLQTGGDHGQRAAGARTSSPTSPHTQPSSRLGSEGHASSPAEQVRVLWDPARIQVPDPSSSSRATVGFCAGNGFAVR